ncbi:MAG TPA: M23 family metallopeptidase, partial [Candidatus Obscuribacterales bacterium]
AAKATLSAERLWTGKFSAPVAARISARFGLRRMVNGKLLADYFHSGLDYAAPTGTPVKAPARGKVILAARGFRLHGNTVALDHGQGVVTFYLHLAKVLVKPGQVVKAGQVVGRVGQSGRASGPHLHFSLYVQEVAANPFYWYSRTF